MQLLEQATREELPVMHRNGVRIRISGRLHQLSPTLQQLLRRAESLTAANHRLTLHLAINYGGRAELVDAMRQIAHTVQRGDLDPEQIDEETLRAHLYNPDLPDPDLVIRTAGELRISNFLLWQTAYAELYVTPTLWPDFDLPHLLEAIRDYQKRVRKFGGMQESLQDGNMSRKEQGELPPPPTQQRS